MDYDAEEQCSVLDAIQALRESGDALTDENINAWLEDHYGESHAMGGYSPVAVEKIASILEEITCVA